MTDALNWIVPARRAVVRSSGIGYRELLAAWIEQLREHAAKLRSWYSLHPEGFDRALMEVEDFSYVFFDDWDDTPVSREEDNVIDSYGANFWARLWKGPLRILREQERQGEPEPSEEVLAVVDTVDPPLQLDHGTVEVRNPDAWFSMGDVVELPLHKLLAAAGKSAYGTAPDYDDVLRFNPTGSFLLGDSVVDQHGQPPAVPLHDNRMAMRFQNLLNTYLGAFYSFDPVFTSDEGARGSAEGRTVYARGMIYAATLSKPADDDHWRFRDLHWCGNSKGKIPQCLPTREGLDGLRKGLPVTPGSVCSDTALFLLNYMIGNHDGVWGSSSVGKTMREVQDAAIQSAFEWVPSAELVELVPEMTVEQLEAAVLRLFERIDPLTDEVDSGRFLVEELDEAELRPGWDEISSSRRSSLRSQASKNQPVSFMQTIQVGLKHSKTTPAARVALLELHRHTIGRVIRLRNEFQKIFASDDWGMCGFIESSSGQKSVDRLRATEGLCFCPDSCRELHKDAFYTGVYQFRFAIRSKRKGLREIVQQPEEERRKKLAKRLEGSRIATVDASTFLSELNVVSLSGHEWCVVRLWPGADLMASSGLPTAGFMAAYHPLTGEPYGRPGGAYFVFEESGRLKRLDVSDDEKYRVFGARPFKWLDIPGNNCTFKLEGSTLYLGEGTDVRSQHLNGITRIRGAQGRQYVQGRHASGDVARPIYVHPVARATGKDEQKTAERRLVDNGNVLYALRSVPLPTIHEARGAFVDTDEAYDHLAKLESRLATVRKSAGSDLRKKIDDFMQYL